MHCIEDFHVLCPDFYTQLIAFFLEQLLQAIEIDGGIFQINDHCHIKNVVEYYLVNGQDIHLIFCHNIADSGNNTRTVYPYYSDNSLHKNVHSFFSSLEQYKNILSLLILTHYTIDIW